ncbi:C40 family peptidase [Paraburkholderia tropica]|uniref:C40 family peptidase n=1 Tax=Paraburkholderia tropica TaxID=92647 RepID=UPI002AB7D044|nr:C40 family peptidase [Paraburkholderia tropica]
MNVPVDLTAALPMIQLHADAEAPRECCGVIVRAADGTLRYEPCRNLAHDVDQFVMDPADAARAEDSGEIVAYAHSHVFRSPQPTDADRAGIAKHGLPWVIVNTPVGSYTITEPQPFTAPLVGRTFVHGVHDCYGLVRDYYAQELGIALNDYPRRFGWWERDDGPDLYRENFGREGFVEIHRGMLTVAALALLQPHDLVLMRMGARRDNHMAVHVGNGVILHHLIDQLSRREALQEHYQRRATAILRHCTLIEQEAS